ncbi:MAG: CvpA family protein [Lepagella sp.]
MIYTLVVLVVGALSVVWGFRRGLGRQTSSIVAIAFGLVSARLLAPGLQQMLYGAFDSLRGAVEEQFVYETLSASIVFVAVYSVFRAILSFIDRVIGQGEKTLIGSLGGALFATFKHLVMLSVLFNLMVGIDLDSGLMKHAQADDGNVVREILLLFPSLSGGSDAEDLALKIQLREAKKIS